MTSSELNSSILALASTLAAQRTAAAGLAETLRLKQRILVEHRLGELQACAEREQALASKLALLESQRSAQSLVLAEGLAGPGGLPAALTLCELLEFLPAGEHTELLRETADSLQEELDELQGMNSVNCQLTQNLLDYTALVIRLLTQGTNHAAYSARGRLNDAPPGAGLALLDNCI
jgi:hypothetical protein